MLDRDLAELYGVETRTLNQAVKRNKERFPERYMFQLDEEEMKYLDSPDNNLKSQSVTSRWGGTRKLAYVFTEQGVSMLSAVLKSKKAVDISIRIIDAFVEMRHYIQNNANVFNKFEQIDQKLLSHDNQLNQIFKAIESKQLTPNQGIFYDGQIFDAYRFISNLIEKAESKIILIDNYINEDTLTMLSKKKKEVKATIYTREITSKTKLAEKRFNQQYGNLKMIQFNKSHDRFLIIDNQIYHIGASLKDAGKRWFAFSKIERPGLELLERLD
ncbi:MAG: ORF6N domain-containing protein, partial [Candidatus Woesearchaeota archaeon]